MFFAHSNRRKEYLYLCLRLFADFCLIVSASLLLLLFHDVFCVCFRVILTLVKLLNGMCYDSSLVL